MAFSGSVATGIATTLLVRIDPAAMLSITQSLSLQMLGAVVPVLAMIAAADYLFQYRQCFERQKMSVRELKEEIKQTNGNPEIKAKIRQIRHIRLTRSSKHNGGGAGSLRGYYQHDPLRGGAQIRERMNAPVWVAQGRRPDRPQDSRGCRRPQHSDCGKPAARPRTPCHRGDRLGDPARALPGGRGSDWMRDAAQSRGCPRQGMSPSGYGRLALRESPKGLVLREPLAPIQRLRH